jgi:hypothetical protein
MSSAKKSDIVEDLVTHFRSSMFEAMLFAGLDRATAYKAIKHFDKINQDEYRYIHRIVDKKKGK